MKKQMFSIVALLMITFTASAASWTKKTAPLMTPWGEALTSDNVWAEYPRPSMTRGDWMNLNGEWGYFKRSSVNYNYESSKSLFNKAILVPFPIESALSGIMDNDFSANKNATHMYRRTFMLSDAFNGKHTLLHFGAVDWRCTVYINGKEAGSHDGGCDPFSFDITDLLNASGDQEIQVAVWDPTSAGGQPNGKQSNNPGGIWYTPSSGIWQTVWIEPVDEVYVESYETIPNIDNGTVTVNVKTSASATVELKAMFGGTTVCTKSGTAGRNIQLSIPSAKLWSPDEPNLYDLEITVKKSGKEVDKVMGYFGMRKFSRGMYDNKPCVLLNNEPLYMYGPLDQGWWPDGLLTPPSYEAMVYDLQVMKDFGMNMVRKHIKVENDLWFDWCDRHGLVVWQDMPSGGGSGLCGSKEWNQQNFYRENEAIIDAFRHHPSIGAWVVYNEAWGQDAESGMQHTRRGVESVINANHDPGRFVHAVTGWYDVEMGDFIDVHSYPAPNASVNPINERVASCGEFGGITLLLKDHMWSGSQQVYTAVEDGDYFTTLYDNYTDRLQSLQRDRGLWMSVYTQITDVEQEVNGLLTYDRKVLKVSPAQQKMMRKHIERTVNSRYTSAKTVVKAGDEDASINWKYTTTTPADNWYEVGFDEAGWNTGAGGFGSSASTKWNTSDIWIRRNFKISGITTDDLYDLRLWIKYDEGCEVYINGNLAAKTTGYVNNFEQRAIFDEALQSLHLDGTDNTIAIHCHQTEGGQHIDCGLKLRQYNNNSDLEITDVPASTPKPEYKAVEGKAYLMAFHSSSTHEMLYAYSLDGSEWTALNGRRGVMKGEWANTKLTAPFIRRVNVDGKDVFHLTANIDDAETAGFYHWQSEDLINWTPTGETPKVTPSTTSSGYAQSPEWIYEPTSKRYYVYWTAVNNNRNTVYYCSTKDWKTFSNPTVYFDPDMSASHIHIENMDDKYYAFFYNGDRNVCVAQSTDLRIAKDKFQNTQRLFGYDIFKANAPQSFPALDGSGWYLYYRYTNGTGFGMSASGKPEEVKWYSNSEESFTMPQGMEEGSVVVISAEELEALKKAYNNEEYALLPTAETEAQTWKYQTSSNAATTSTWTGKNYRDTSWKEGLAGFGNLTPPGSFINTTWNTRYIRLRHKLDLTGMTPEQIHSIAARIYYDEDVKVYFNGVLAFEATGYLTGYRDIPLNQEALDALVANDTNVVAIECMNGGGGQYIDFGLSAVRPDATGISNVVAPSQPSSGIYNLAGQRVTESHKGIKIINGKKTLQ